MTVEACAPETAAPSDSVEPKPVRRPVDPYELLAPAIPKSNAFIMMTRARRRRWMYSLRVWVNDKDTGELRPTTIGVTFAEDKLEAVRDALIEACKRVGLDD